MMIMMVTWMIIIFDVLYRQEEERREKETSPKHNRRIELLRKSKILTMTMMPP